jgi:hypothetical protein
MMIYNTKEIIFTSQIKETLKEYNAYLERMFSNDIFIYNP